MHTHTHSHTHSDLEVNTDLKATASPDPHTGEQRDPISWRWDLGEFKARFLSIPKPQAVTCDMDKADRTTTPQRFSKPSPVANPGDPDSPSRVQQGHLLPTHCLLCSPGPHPFGYSRLSAEAEPVWTHSAPPRELAVSRKRCECTHSHKMSNRGV